MNFSVRVTLSKHLKLLCLFIINAPWSSAIASQCQEVNAPAQLAEFRQDAEAFGKQGNTWLMLKGGFPMQCESVNDSTQSCTSAEAFTVVTFKQGKLISGIQSGGGADVQFSFYQNGELKCEVLKTMTSASTSKGPKPDNCSILSDTILMYKMSEQSQPLLDFGKAKLFLRSGDPICTADGNTAYCESKGPAQVLLQAPGAALKAIETYGHKVSKMTFYDDGDLGCEN
jgi:hypothetical protein